VIRVLLADDERLVCAHLRTILESAGDITVVGEAYDGAEAVEGAVRLRPDVVLLDLRMPGVDGLAALERIVTLAPAPRVVVLTTFDEDAAVLSAMRRGATGFLLKTTAPEDLAALVRVAAEGHTVLSPAASRRLVAATDERRAERERAGALLVRLSEREQDVLRALAAGLSNAQISARLHLSEATVKGHVSRVMAKLGCENRTQVALVAHAVGVPDPD
jgi:DNA-binding NarL/FixJ family response regulator